MIWERRPLRRVQFKGRWGAGSDLLPGLEGGDTLHPNSGAVQVTHFLFGWARSTGPTKNPNCQMCHFGHYLGNLFSFFKKIKNNKIQNNIVVQEGGVPHRPPPPTLSTPLLVISLCTGADNTCPSPDTHAYQRVGKPRSPGKMGWGKITLGCHAYIGISIIRPPHAQQKKQVPECFGTICMDG